MSSLLTRMKNAPDRWKKREQDRRNKNKLKKSGEVDKSKFDEDYVEEMEQRRKDSEAKKKKKKQPPKNTKPKTPPKNTKPKTPPKENKDKVKIPKDTKPKTPPKDTKPKTPPKDTKKKDPKKDNGRLTDNKASDFLDGVKNPSKGEKPKKKPKKRLSAREKMRKKNEARFGKAHVDKLRNKTADFKKMKKGGMTKAEFIKKYPRSITAQKAAGIRR